MPHPFTIPNIDKNAIGKYTINPDKKYYRIKDYAKVDLHEKFFSYVEEGLPLRYSVALSGLFYERVFYWIYIGKKEVDELAGLEYVEIPDWESGTDDDILLSFEASFYMRYEVANAKYVRNSLKKSNEFAAAGMGTWQQPLSLQERTQDEFSRKTSTKTTTQSTQEVTIKVVELDGDDWKKRNIQAATSSGNFMNGIFNEDRINEDRIIEEGIILEEENHNIVVDEKREAKRKLNSELFAESERERIENWCNRKETRSEDLARVAKESDENRYPLEKEQYFVDEGFLANKGNRLPGGNKTIQYLKDGRTLVKNDKGEWVEQEKSTTQLVRREFLIREQSVKLSNYQEDEDGNYLNFGNFSLTDDEED